MADETSLDRRALMAALCVPVALSAPGLAASANADQDVIRAVLSNYANAWRRGDIAGIANLYHDEFTLHYPGRHALAGTHVGKREALRILRIVSERTNRKLVSILDVMSGPHRGCLNVTEQWTRNGDSVLLERVFVYTVRDEKLVQCWLFDADQEVVAKFLADS